jgi:hypothetical protein
VVPDINHHIWWLDRPCDSFLSRHSHLFAKFLNRSRTCLLRAAAEVAANDTPRRMGDKTPKRLGVDTEKWFGKRLELAAGDAAGENDDDRWKSRWAGEGEGEPNPAG